MREVIVFAFLIKACFCFSQDTSYVFGVPDRDIISSTLTELGEVLCNIPEHLDKDTIWIVENDKINDVYSKIDLRKGESWLLEIYSNSEVIFRIDKLRNTFCGRLQVYNIGGNLTKSGAISLLNIKHQISGCEISIRNDQNSLTLKQIKGCQSSKLSQERVEELFAQYAVLLKLPCNHLN